MQLDDNPRQPPLSPPPYSIFELPEPPTDLIFDDGEPLESNRHRIAMNVLIDSTLEALKDRDDFFTGGNMFVYYSREQRMNRDFRGPDYFVTLEVDGQRERQGWVVWEEQGRYPDVIVELMSPSTAKIDKTVKKDLYEGTFHTLDYYVYNPFDPSSLEGWHLNAQRHYEPITPNQQGWLWCETLRLWFGVWQGSVRREAAVITCPWLRLFDRNGQLVPLPEEAAQARAAQATQRAEQEALRAQQEAQRAEQEAQRAEQEAQRAAKLAARLKALGIDPDQDGDS